MAHDDDYDPTLLPSADDSSDSDGNSKPPPAENQLAFMLDGASRANNAPFAPISGNWNPVGGLPPALSNNPLTNRWGPGFVGDSHVRIAPVEMTASRQQVVQDIAYASNLMGGNLQTAVQIGYVESRLNSNAQAGTSSAKGTFQIIDTTAADIINRILPQELPHTAEGERILAELRNQYNPFDSRQNAILGVALLKYNHDMNSQALGREATPGEDYLMHFSPLLAQKLRNGEGNEYIPANIAAANPTFAGMTIAQLANHFNDLMNIDVNPILTAAGVSPNGQNTRVASTGGSPQAGSSWLQGLTAKAVSIADHVADRLGLNGNPAPKPSRIALKSSTPDLPQQESHTKIAAGPHAPVKTASTIPERPQHSVG